jgi:SAM-dependent methyltransferase
VFGVVSTFRAAASNLLAPSYDTGEFDRRFGTDTSSFVSVDDSGMPAERHAEALYYSPAVEPVVHRLIRSLPIATRDFTFIDVGSGKGRVVLLASMYAFDRVIGIELSPVTARIAEENVALFQSSAADLQQCADIAVQREDALGFDIPDTNLVFFLFNPFQGSILSGFVQRVEEFVMGHPDRRVLIAYLNPAAAQPLLGASPYFREIANVRLLNPSWSWMVWEAPGVGSRVRQAV